MAKSKVLPVPVLAQDELSEDTAEIKKIEQLGRG